MTVEDWVVHEPEHQHVALQFKGLYSKSKERRCSECFDVCGKTFENGNAMSLPDTSSASGVSSNVRSMRVTSGVVYAVMNYCL
ncbi:unnamed protein product, partial [Symbiodinium microadriaticum]